MIRRLGRAEYHHISQALSPISRAPLLIVRSSSAWVRVTSSASQHPPLGLQSGARSQDRPCRDALRYKSFRIAVSVLGEWADPARASMQQRMPPRTLRVIRHHLGAQFCCAVILRLPPPAFPSPLAGDLGSVSTSRAEILRINGHHPHRRG